ncbi:MAG TPA: stage II sporulation protein M [Verrucomicrobiota bacterium]|nr:stage II sporulation protein M [Verrucomicrobiota bacterium]
MIIDLQRFVAAERPHWTQLETILDRVEADPAVRMNLAELTAFHRLYERACADLAKITTFSAEPETRRYLETLVARAYGEIHETRERRGRLHPVKWFFQTLPQTFRRHVRAFYLSTAIMLAGCALGGLAIMLDPESKPVLMPFPHLLQDPAERVAKEESAEGDRLEGHKSQFSAFLMTHNTKVSIFTLALGMTWGVGTILVLFSNGVMLGAVAVDYVLAGQSKFLMGWLMPHGVIEIPAILIAGQAGLVLASALIGRGSRATLTARLRGVSRDVVTLIFGVAIMLVWAGIVEAFLSQYHEPAIPYAAKITFGFLELGLLVLFLAKSGVNSSRLNVPGSGPETVALKPGSTRNAELRTRNP